MGRSPSTFPPLRRGAGGVFFGRGPRGTQSQRKTAQASRERIEVSWPCSSSRCWPCLHGLQPAAKRQGARPDRFECLRSRVAAPVINFFKERQSRAQAVTKLRIADGQHILTGGTAGSQANQPQSPQCQQLVQKEPDHGTRGIARGAQAEGLGPGVCIIRKSTRRQPRQPGDRSHLRGGGARSRPAGAHKAARGARAKRAGRSRKP